MVLTSRSTRLENVRLLIRSLIQKLYFTVNPGVPRGHWCAFNALKYWILDNLLFYFSSKEITYVQYTVRIVLADFAVFD